MNKKKGQNSEFEEPLFETPDEELSVNEAPIGPDGEYVEEFFWVRFSAKSSPNETEDVDLTVNGEKLIIAREVNVIVPKRYLICADNATYPMYRIRPGETRKTTHHVKLYPYTKIKRATKKEYDAMKAEGTRKMRENIKRYGFDVTPDQVSGD